MKKAEFIQAIQNIGQVEDIAQIRTQLAELQNNVCADYDERDNAIVERDAFKTDNETLRNANMKLFLQVGNQNPKNDDKDKTPPDENNLKYEDLFDDKGDIK